MPYKNTGSIREKKLIFGHPNLDALKLEIAQIQFINTHYQTIIELCAEFKEILSVCIPFLTILQVIQLLMCALYSA